MEMEDGAIQTKRQDHVELGAARAGSCAQHIACVLTGAKNTVCRKDCPNMSHIDEEGKSKKIDGDAAVLPRPPIFSPRRR